MARKPQGAHRSAVGLGMEEPNAWVLYALALQVGGERRREAEGSDPDSGAGTLSAP